PALSPGEREKLAEAWEGSMIRDHFPPISRPGCRRISGIPHTIRVPHNPQTGVRCRVRRDWAAGALATWAFVGAVGQARRPGADLLRANSHWPVWATVPHLEVPLHGHRRR